MDLFAAEVGRTYLIRQIATDDPEMDAFLFRLGAYSGETITVVSKKRRSCIVAIKNSRYSIDKKLAQKVLVVAQ
ncbi:MAG: FeoA family protein [Trueperella sp.]|nr:FeoA family protein [Trueperella sp.]